MDDTQLRQFLMLVGGTYFLFKVQYKMLGLDEEVTYVKSASEEIADFSSTLILSLVLYYVSKMYKANIFGGSFIFGYVIGVVLTSLYAKGYSVLQNETAYSRENNLNSKWEAMKYLMLFVIVFFFIIIVAVNTKYSVEHGSDKTMHYLLYVFVTLLTIGVYIIKRNREYEVIRVSMGFIALIFATYQQFDHDHRIASFARGVLMSIFICHQSYFGNGFVVDRKGDYTAHITKAKCRALLEDEEAVNNDEKFKQNTKRSLRNMRWAISLTIGGLSVFILLLYYIVAAKK